MYMPTNEFNVIEGNSKSDKEVSRTTPAIMASVVSHYSVLPISDGNRIAPLHVPHLYWECVTDGPANSFPITINDLMDHGSCTVLINEQFTDSLGLHHRKLIRPETVEMAMQSGGKCVEYVLKDWVKLKLHDLSLLGFDTGIPRVGLSHTVTIPRVPYG